MAAQRPSASNDIDCLEIVDDNDEVWDPSDRVPDSELAALHRDACIGAHLGNR